LEEILQIINTLEIEYGIHEKKGSNNPLDCLILTILSQNTNDKNRDIAYDSIKISYRDWEDVLLSGEGRLKEVIRACGLASIKSKRIIKILSFLKETRGSLNLDFLKELSPQEAEKYLLSFEGVGLKTARCVLMFGLDKPAFPVDTHIFRVSRRLGIIPMNANRTKAHEILQRNVPEGKAFSFHLNLIEHGRRICRSRNPICSKCCLEKLCKNKAP
jgi:endonuclease-3